MRAQLTRVLLMMTSSLVVVANALAKPQPDGCPEDKPMVVNSFATFRNVADQGTDGHVWALDFGTKYIQIWQIGENAYCVKRRDVGTFTTFGGPSPAGSGVVRYGVSGSFDGTTYLRIYGKFEPKVPTSGFIGDFDEQCRQDGSCSGTAPRASELYFSRVNHIDFGWFLYAANAGTCGTWIQEPSGSTGDIAC